MHVFLITILSAFFGLVITFFVQLFSKQFISKKLDRKDRICVRSVEALSKLLPEVRKRNPTEQEKLKLWADTMNYVMTAHSKQRALKYIKKISETLQDEFEPLFEESEKILSERFRKPATPAKKTRVVL